MKMRFVHFNQVILDTIKDFLENQLDLISQSIELNQENSLDKEGKSKH